MTGLMKAARLILTKRSNFNRLDFENRLSYVTDVTEDDIKKAISPIRTIVLAVILKDNWYCRKSLGKS